LTAPVPAVHAVSCHSPHQFERSMQVAVIFIPAGTELITASKAPVVPFSLISAAVAEEANVKAKRVFMLGAFIVS
jgi:hypothetical protein